MKIYIDNFTWEQVPVLPQEVTQIDQQAVAVEAAETQTDLAAAVEVEYQINLAVVAAVENQIEWAAVVVEVEVQLLRT